MLVIFIQKPGIDLYRTLLESETSRLILRFYQPRRFGVHGLEVPVGSLGSGLSLTSELRWYIRRYTSDVFFRTGDGQLISHQLALEIYNRHLSYPGDEWPCRYTCTCEIDYVPVDLTILCLCAEMR